MIGIFSSERSDFTSERPQNLRLAAIAVISLCDSSMAETGSNKSLRLSCRHSSGTLPCCRHSSLLECSTRPPRYWNRPRELSICRSPRLPSTPTGIIHGPVDIACSREINFRSRPSIGQSLHRGYDTGTVGCKTNIPVFLPFLVKQKYSINLAQTRLPPALNTSSLSRRWS